MSNNEKGGEILITCGLAVLAVSAIVIYQEYSARKEIEEDIRVRESRYLDRHKSKSRSKSEHRKHSKRNQFESMDLTGYDSEDEDQSYSSPYAQNKKNLSRSTPNSRNKRRQQQQREDPMLQTMQPHINEVLVDVGTQEESKDEFDRDKILADLMRDMETIGEVQADDEGFLSTSDFCRVYKLCYKYGHESLYPQIQALNEDRRNALRQKKYDDYKYFIDQKVELEEQIKEGIQMQIFEYFNITQDIFQGSYQQIHDTQESRNKFNAVLDQQVEQAVQRQQRKYDNLLRKGQTARADKIKLIKPTKKQLLEIFEYECMLKMEALEKLIRIEDNETLKEENELYNQKLADQIYIKFGIEKEEYNYRCTQHEIFKMPVYQDKVQQINAMVTPEFKERMDVILQEDNEDGSQLPDLDDNFMANASDNDGDVMFDDHST